MGWNSQESGYQGILGREQATVAAYTRAVRKRFGERADEVLRLYPAATDEAVEQAATDLASDGFLGYCTWKWADSHAKTGGDQPVYRYFYSRPPMRPEMGNASAEWTAPLGNLATNQVYDWTPEDYQVSKVMQAYFANFVKTGNPNGPGLPPWTPINRSNPVSGMHLDVKMHPEPEQHRDRYLFWDRQGPK